MKAATIAIIGGGNMGASLVGGLIADGYSPNKIWMTDISDEKLQHLNQRFGVNTTQNNREAAEAAQILILAVKPQIMASVASDLANVVQKHKPLVISIAAGIRESSLQHFLGGNVAIVRCMPNTPALIGAGASALYANSLVKQSQSNDAESILRAVGLVVWLQEEKQMDAVTALSGCGPAYFFLIMESLQRAAEKAGLSEEVARLLTVQTAFGAARMAMESDETVDVLRQRVASPGGSTEQGLRVLEEAGIREIFADTINAASKRSEELAAMFDSKEA